MRCVLVVVLVPLLAGLARAGERTRPGVLDNVGLFGKSTILEANKEIAHLREDYKIDLVIETFAELPPRSDSEKQAWWPGGARNRALHAWAQDMADRGGMAPTLYSAVWAWAGPRSNLADSTVALWLAGSPPGQSIDGIYIAIFHGRTSAQRDVRVVGWPTKREDAIPWEKRDDLRKLLARDLGRNPDGALLDAIDLFRSQVRYLHAASPSPLNVPATLGLVGGLVGVWLVLVAVRYRLARRAAPGRPASLYQPAVMGALFGVPAAFWVHDQLFRALPAEAPAIIEPPPAEPPPPPPSPEAPASEENTDKPPPEG